ncbi:Ig-like domain-containing protein, partial [Erwinia sp. CGal63]|uniref:Ig-like domain-containing protein n=1 Tax=Erwinia sp. CGal63 TaxID=2919889 RepID=UPI003008C1AB
MNLELIIKDAGGKVIAKHPLVSKQPLSLTPPAGASTFEVHSNDGNIPPKIQASKTANGMKLEWADEATDENYQVLLENYSPDTPPVITASGTDGTVYAFDYDTSASVYELADGTEGLLATDSSGVTLAAGGSLAGAALLIGLGVANHSGGGGGGGSSSSTEENAASRSTVLTDDNGNIIGDGGTINDNTPTFSGEGMLPGSVVTISDNGVVIGETVADENGRWSFTPEQPLADGDHAIVIDGTQADGTPISENVNVIVDSQGSDGTSNTENGNNGGEDGLNDGSVDPIEVAPVVVVTDDSGSVINSGAATSDTTPTFSGSNYQPGSAVILSENGVTLREITVDENGSWTVTLEAQPEGAHSITITGTGLNGAGSSNDFELLVDITAPEAVDTSDVVITDENGNAIEPGSPNSNATPTFNGDGEEPGSTVIISDGDEVIGEVVVGDDGSWSFTPDEPLADGDHDISFEVVDEAGNGSGPSDPIDYPVDTTAPETVDTSGVTITDENGNAIEPGTPNSNNTPTFSGDAEPGSTVIISDGDEVIGEVVVGDDGSWSFTPDEPLADGDHDISFEVVDEAGNGSGPSDPIDYPVDTTAPEAVDSSGVTITDENGNAIEPGTPNSNNTPTFSGDAEPGSTVIISDGDEVIGEVVVGDDGSWSFTPDEPLADGDHDISFEVVDEAGNGSGPSDPIDYPVDTTAPEAVDTSGVTITDENGNTIEPGSPSSNTTPTFSGDAEPGSTVVVSDGDEVIGEAVVDEDGSWSFTPDEPLADGDHDISFEVVDEAGNSSGPSDPIDYPVDTTAPEAVDSSGVVITDEEGNVIEPGSPNSNTTPTFSGSGAEPGATVVVSDGDTVLGEATVAEDGSWSFTPDEPLADGDHNIAFEVVDEAGNSSAPSDPIDYTVDTTAPEGIDVAGVIVTDAEGNAIEPGAPSANTTPTFIGSGAEPGATVVVSDGDTVLGEATVAEDGSWSFTPDEPLADGDHDISFEVVDEAGNGSGPSDPIDYPVDTTAPETVDTSGVTITDENGNAIEPGTPNSNNTPTFSGDAEPGSTVVVSDGDEVIGEVVVGEDGSWSFTPDEPLADGDHNISFEVVDEAGNGSGPSDPIDYPVDTTAPEAVDSSGVVITDEEGNVIEPGSPNSNTTPTFSGNGAEPGATVVVSDGDTVLGEATVAEDGSWSFTPDEPLAEGDHDISFEVVDEAGNSSGPSDPIDYPVDTTAPEAVDSSGVVITDAEGNAIEPGAPSSVTTPTFSGSAEPGTTIVVSDGDTVLGEATVAEDGSWSFTPDEPLAEGDHDISFEVVDEAGNSSAPSDPIDYTVDTTAPEGIDAAAVAITDAEGNVIEPGAPSSVTTPTFSGSAEPGTTIVVSDGDTV